MQIYPNIGKLILASASPRRRELLASLGLDFEIRIPDINEQPLNGEEPRTFAERLAREKAAAVDAPADSTCIAADTIVVQSSRILGKPTDEAQAFEMLSKLSGRMHEVITGVCVSNKQRTEVISVTTQVFFRSLEKEEIECYIATGCPMDKAGAYAIQGGAAQMVREIRGSYTNVVGLPLCELHELLISF
ncbi:Maf family protein [Pontiellaceae bacterium B1224]|nr:Maf family protein [Pontiellaceae bacterium B1224]